MGVAYAAQVESVPDLISFWTFQEPSGAPRTARGPFPYALAERNGPIERVEGGPFGPYAARLKKGQWLETKRADCPELNLHGPDAQVTVAAWVRRQPRNNCEAIAGMWNETEAKRQYCLFLNLRIWESADQVCGHVSSVGGPTPGHRWCMDAAIGSTPIRDDGWRFVAFTYDSVEVRAYLDGQLDRREGRNPYDYPGGLFTAGPDGSDFTVGAVHRSGEMGNWFIGVIGGLAVFRRALSDAEIARIAVPPTQLQVG